MKVPQFTLVWYRISDITELEQTSRLISKSGYIELGDDVQVVRKFHGSREWATIIGFSSTMELVLEKFKTGFDPQAFCARTYDMLYRTG